MRSVCVFVCVYVGGSGEKVGSQGDGKSQDQREKK